MTDARYIRGPFDRTQRHDILDRAMRNEISRAQAEAEAKEIGAKPFTTKPSPDDFNPMQEAHWDIAMVWAWLDRESADEVREVWNDYRKEVWDWESAGEGSVVAQRAPVDLVELFVRHGSAEGLFRRLVRNGEINATAKLCGNDERVAIPAVRWHDLKEGMIGRRIGLFVAGTPWCYDVLFSRTECMEALASAKRIVASTAVNERKAADTAGAPDDAQERPGQVDRAKRAIGRPPVKTLATAARMKADIEANCTTPHKLKAMKQEARATKYGVNRETARRALDIVLSEIVGK